MAVLDSRKPSDPRPWLWVLSGLTFVAVVGVSWSLDRVSIDSSGRLALAFIPVVLWGATIALLVRTMRRLDELQRRIQLEALAIAFPAAMMLGMAVEYAQKAGFARGLDVGDVWPAMILLYVPALAFAHWKYR